MPTDRVVIVVKQGRGKPPKVFRRPYACLTFNDAMDQLAEDGVETTDPYQINGEEVPWSSDRVLKPGDKVTAEDP